MSCMVMIRKPFGKTSGSFFQTLREDVSQNIVIGNLPDLTRLPRFQAESTRHRSDDWSV